MVKRCTLSDFLSLDAEQIARAEMAQSGTLPHVVEALQQDEPASYPPAKALVDFTRIYLRDTDPHLFRAACTVKGERGWRFLFGCSFFRAIDNVADSTAPAAQQDQLIERYLMLSREDVNLTGVSPADIFETIILAYMALEQEGSPRTLDCLHDIIHSLRLDLDRRYQILSWREYTALNHYRAVRPMEAFFRLLLNRNDEITWQLAWHFGTFAIYIDDIHDLTSDLELGFVNITQEELQALGVVDVAAMTPALWQTFVAHRNALLLEHSRACLQLVDWPEVAPVRHALEASVRAVIARLEGSEFQTDQTERWSPQLVQRLMKDLRR